MRKLVKYACVLLFIPILVSAHGDGTTRQQISDDYKIEFEYNTSGTIFAGDYVTYNTYLLHAADNQPVDFDSVFVQFVRNDGFVITTATLAPDANGNGNASLATVIQAPGSYTAKISFAKGAAQLAESSFDFAVEPDPASAESSDNKNLWLTLGLCLFAVLAVAIVYFKRHFRGYFETNTKQDE